MSDPRKDIDTAKSLLRHALDMLSGPDLSMRQAELVREIETFLYPKKIDVDADRLAAFKAKLSPKVVGYDASKIEAVDLDASKIVASPVSGPDFAGTCPRCGHGKHDNTFCLNMASDNDCKCTYPERAWIDE